MNWIRVLKLSVHWSSLGSKKIRNQQDAPSSSCQPRQIDHFSPARGIHSADINVGFFCWLDRLDRGNGFDGGGRLGFLQQLKGSLCALQFLTVTLLLNCSFRTVAVGFELVKPKLLRGSGFLQLEYSHASIYDGCSDFDK